MTTSKKINTTAIELSLVDNYRHSTKNTVALQALGTTKKGLHSERIQLITDLKTIDQAVITLRIVCEGLPVGEEHKAPKQAWKRSIESAFKKTHIDWKIKFNMNNPVLSKVEAVVRMTTTEHIESLLMPTVGSELTKKIMKEVDSHIKANEARSIELRKGSTEIFKKEKAQTIADMKKALVELKKAA